MYRFRRVSGIVMLMTGVSWLAYDLVSALTPIENPYFIAAFSIVAAGILIRKLR